MTAARRGRQRVLLTATVSVALTLGATADLRAQSPFDSVPTPNGMCRKWAFIAGGSNPSDSSYSRCALDRGPTLRRSSPMPPAPRNSVTAHGSYAIIVNADGRADARLTRPLSQGGDSAYNRQLRETLLQWRFEPGMLRGVAVRSGFELELTSDYRNDTLPSRLEWTYRQGLNRDTLVGKWIVESALPPFTSVQQDSIYAALLRRLAETQVLVRDLGEPYCLVMPGRDSAAHARLSEVAHRILTTPGRHTWSVGPYGCGRDPQMLRVVLPRVHRTENGRAVLRPMGDHLPNYPPGYEGRSWRAWNGRCVANLPAEGPAGMDCAIAPLYLPGELRAFLQQQEDNARRARGASDDGDSLRLMVVATTTDAYYADTMRAVVRGIPRLSERAIIDTIPPCGSWSAHSLQNADTLYVLNGDPTARGLQHLTRVTRRPPPTSRDSVMRCGPQEPRRRGFMAFLLGDVGDRATSPITLCFSECAKSYVIDPERHTLAERADFIFRLADLRQESRAGGRLTYRIHLEGAPSNVIPLVVYRSAARGRYNAWLARPVAPNTWDYPVSISTDDWPGLEVRIYFLVR